MIIRLRIRPSENRKEADDHKKEATPKDEKPLPEDDLDKVAGEYHIVHRETHDLPFFEDNGEYT